MNKQALVFGFGELVVIVFTVICASELKEEKKEVSFICVRGGSKSPGALCDLVELNAVKFSLRIHIQKQMNWNIVTYA